jgi:hypothetical protein
MSDGALRFPFFAGVRAASAPLLLWALHFAFCYVVVAVGCTAVGRGADAAPGDLRLALVAATVLALALGMWLLLRACRASLAGAGDLLPRVRLACAALAFVAMLWTGLPLTLLPVCGTA